MEQKEGYASGLCKDSTHMNILYFPNLSLLLVLSTTVQHPVLALQSNDDTPSSINCSSEQSELSLTSCVKKHFRISWITQKHWLICEHTCNSMEIAKFYDGGHKLVEYFTRDTGFYFWSSC